MARRSCSPSETASGPDVVVYPVDRVAIEHGAGVDQETSLPAEAYARFTKPHEIPFRDEFLTD